MLCYVTVGLSGLDELETINDCFFKYEETLYSRSSVTFERSTQSKEINAQLDESIREFLVEVSPYLLLSAARKAVEWLIYRYYEFVAI